MPLTRDMTVAQRVQLVEAALERLFRHRHGFDVQQDQDGLVLWVADPADPENSRIGISLWVLARELEARL